MTDAADVPPETDAGRPAEESLGFLLSKLGFAAHRSFSAALAPLDLDPRHGGLLRRLGAAEGSSQQALAQRLAIPASRVVKLVDDLERRGLVERRRSASDRRANALYLTADGRKLLERAQHVAAAHDADLASPLDPDERDTLLALLRKLVDALDEPLDAHQDLAGTETSGRESYDASGPDEIQAR